MSKKLLRIFLRGFSLTSALFIFEACYGPIQDYGGDMLVEGLVVANATGLPIKNIRVSVPDNAQYTFTDDQGKFSMYTEKKGYVTMSFEDIDMEANGRFLKRDTVLNNPPEKVSLKISLKEQQ